MDAGIGRGAFGLFGQSMARMGALPARARILPRCSPGSHLRAAVIEACFVGNTITPLGLRLTSRVRAVTL
jgi:hypothetical protein